jgi:methyltransferase family protein
VTPAGARLRLAGRLALRDPRLLLEYAGWMARGSTHPSTGQRRPPSGAVTPAVARTRIADALRPWDAGPARDLVAGQTLPGGTGAAATAVTMAGDRSLGELVYGLVRAAEPDVVIETGVATGVTSAYVLAALEDNGGGELHSVDLPPADMVGSGLVGCVVPGELRERWRYHWGSARRLLPGILKRTAGARRVFVHDSDHSYANMRWELELAWDALDAGDWLVADDVDLHGAFADVAGSRGARPLFVAQLRKPGATGIMPRRSGADSPW